MPNIPLEDDSTMVNLDKSPNIIEAMLHAGIGQATLEEKSIVGFRVAVVTRDQEGTTTGMAAGAVSEDLEAESVKTVTKAMDDLLSQEAIR